MGPHVIISGYGRSGSNMILDMFDLHSSTHCRNEPNGGMLLEDVDQFFAEDVPEGFQEKWKAALARVAATTGKRDRLPIQNKEFLKSGPVSQFMNWAQSKQRLRTLAGVTGEEWQSPPSVYDPIAFANAFPVFKIGLSESVALAHEDPDQVMVHIARRPEDFLKSWYNRYVMKRGSAPEALFAESEPRRTRTLAHYDADPARFKTYSLTRLFESELWLWRYNHDRLYALKGSPRYMFITYDEAKSKPVETTEAIYNFTGLSYDESHAALARGMENKLFAAPHQSSPMNEIKQAIDYVLDGLSLPV